MRIEAHKNADCKTLISQIQGNQFTLGKEKKKHEILGMNIF